MCTMDDYASGYALGCDENYPAYYCNGESDEFANGYVDGRFLLYSRVEDDEGNIKDKEGRDALMSALYSSYGVWGAVRKIEKMEEG